MATTKVTKNELDDSVNLRATNSMASIATITTTYQTAATYTVPDGVANTVLQINAAFEFNASVGAAEMTARILHNDTNVLGQNYWNPSGLVYFNTIPVLGQVTVNAGDTIKFQVARTSGSGNSLGTRSRYLISS